MAQLQYIGARYVPKFYENPDDGTNNWKAGVTYEPLTVVTDSGDSYTSKIPVPGSVGAPSLNPTYWAKTGDYNAAITALQAQVNGIDNEVKQLQDIQYNGLKINCNEVLRKIDYQDVLSGDVNYVLQASVYNPTRDTVLHIFEKNNTYGILVETTTDMITVVRRVQMDNVFAHGNGATFNPTTNKYYVVCAEGAGLTPADNKVAVIDATSLSFDNYISLSPAMATPDESMSWHINYDPDEDLYYTRTGQEIQIYDSSFNLTDSYALDKVDLLIKDLSGADSSIGQASFFANGLYHVLYVHEVNGTRTGVSIVSLNKKSNNIVCVNNIALHSYDDEPESVVTIGDIAYLLCCVNAITVYQMLFSNVPYYSTDDPYATGIVLSGTENIDNIVISGRYIIKNTDNIGQPTTGFPTELLVESSRMTRIIQKLTWRANNNMYIIMREINMSLANPTWTAWEDISPAVRPDITYNMYNSKMILAGYISSSGKSINLYVPSSKKLNALAAANIAVSGTGRMHVNNTLIYQNGSNTLDLANMTVSVDVQDDGFILILQKPDTSVWGYGSAETPVSGYDNITAELTLQIRNQP